MSPSECGACNLCCTVMRVEMDPPKPEHVRCKHACRAGCAIYETRPEPCRKWFCVWHGSHSEEAAAEGLEPLPDWLRPDRCRVVLNSNSRGYCLVHPASVGDWRRPRMFEWLCKAARVGVVLIHEPNGHSAALHPDGTTEALRFIGVDPETNERKYIRATVALIEADPTA